MLNAAIDPASSNDPADGAPFSAFAPPIRPQSELRQAITAAYRRPETECLPPLVAAARVSEAKRYDIRSTARSLIEALRAKHKGTGVEGLVQEYSLSSQEGVALMHVLLTTALASTVRDEIPLPEGAKYDVALGAWRGDSGLLAFDPDTDRVSKKQDVETGEDQKGQ